MSRMQLECSGRCSKEATRDAGKTATYDFLYDDQTVPYVDAYTVQDVDADVRWFGGKQRCSASITPFATGR